MGTAGDGSGDSSGGEQSGTELGYTKMSGQG